MSSINLLLGKEPVYFQKGFEAISTYYTEFQ